MQQLAHIENIYQSVFFGFIAALFYFMQSGEPIYELQCLKFTLKHL